MALFEGMMKEWTHRMMEGSGSRSQKAKARLNQEADRAEMPGDGASGTGSKRGERLGRLNKGARGTRQGREGEELRRSDGRLEGGSRRERDIEAGAAMFLGAPLGFEAFDLKGSGRLALPVPGPFQRNLAGFLPAQRGPRKESLGGLQDRQEHKKEKSGRMPAHAP
jgi:hypothetical protein